MTTHDIWTAEATAQATQRYNDGASILMIARELQELVGVPFTKNMVSGKIKRLRRLGVIERAPVTPIVYKTGEYKRHKPRKRPRTKRAALRAQRYIEIDPPTTIAWEAVEGSLHVSLYALQRGQCAYPLADGTYCGCGTRASNCSWCDAHWARIWRPAPDQRPRRDSSQFVR